MNRTGIADQIIFDIQSRILAGSIANGEKFPSEREMAEQYGVSGTTIREAIRALAAMGFVEVRHGSGTIASPRADKLVAKSIAAIIQLNNVGAFDVHEVVRVLVGHAAESAAIEATDEEIAGIRVAAEMMASTASVEQQIANQKVFFDRFSAASHNALLHAMSRFLVAIQNEVTLSVYGNTLTTWKRLSTLIHADRMAVVEALERRDPAEALRTTHIFFDHLREIVESSPRAAKMRLTDPDLSQFVVSLVADGSLAENSTA
jgi:GntR family transcriptional regulator, transcriptional repressor for pyruvate dehydrogenase complex